MTEKPELRKVQFWISKELKEEIDTFAHGLSMNSSDFYKGGALMMKKLLEKGGDITLNLFTRSFKDLEEKQVRKKILEAYKDSRNIY
ncbi:hypothetical protein AYK26_06960 [Euryarchaeota archaeon SM23-78]|nr:MAG: hypothetical protein AYK26_06960 [Euryarchaeota archaeon SM23-78]